MLRADPVVYAAQPGLEIGEHEVNDGQEGLGNLYVAPLRDGGVEIAALAQLGVTTPVVGDDGGTGSHIAVDEATERSGASVRNHGESNTTGIPSGFPLVEAAGPLPLTDFDSAGDEYHIVDATPLAAGTPADVGFVGFDKFVGLTTDPILVGAHHAGAQLVLPPNDFHIIQFFSRLFGYIQSHYHSQPINQSCTSNLNSRHGLTGANQQYRLAGNTHHALGDAAQ